MKLLHDQMRDCRQCSAAGHDATPPVVFSGKAKARALLVGQAPGSQEAEDGLPFQGKSGQRLFTWLEKAGFSEEGFREEHYITAVTRCYPGAAASGRGDRAPSAEEIALCWPFLERELQLVSPLLVVPVGRMAIKVFLGGRPLNEAVGFAHQDDLGRWIVPLPHPSGASSWLNAPENADAMERAIRHLYRLRRKLRL
ncbi:MAG: uracil-DNA glycosylase [bacterium]|nr:uracil-DNA glycosylase [bacterium]